MSKPLPARLQRLAAAGALPFLRACACAAFNADKAPAALLALREIDAPVYDWLTEAYEAGYGQVKGVDTSEWSGEHAASALDATPLEDQDWAPPTWRTWADVYAAIVAAYEAASA